MSKFFLMPSPSIFFIGCDRLKDSLKSSQENSDRHSQTPFSFDLPEKQADLTITQKNRQAFMADLSLSVNAKNITNIIADSLKHFGIHLLTLGKKVRNVHEVLKVNNQLEVTSKK